MYKKNKIAVMVLTMMLAAPVTAADNSIYIDQSGDNATITMTQDGASNYVRGVGAVGNTTPSKLHGDGLIVDITQTGSGNTLNLGAVTGTASGNSSEINYSVTGNNATATIDMNNAGTKSSLANTIGVTQVGDNANTNVNMKGSRNSMTVTQSGGNNNSIAATVDADNTVVTVNQTGGGGNSTTLDLNSSKGTVDIVTVGASNTISITQQGAAGINGHFAKVDLAGSSNTVNITQNGSIDMTTNIKSVGNTNSFTIIQRN